MLYLLQHVAAANYRSGKINTNDVLSQVATLPFNGSDGDPNGFAKLRQMILCEDGSRYNALQMHPKWTKSGSISALFQNLRIPERGFFKASVGFAKGAQGTDGVTFELWLTIGARNRVRILSLRKKYDGRMQNLEADLSAWAGRNVRIELVVNAGASAGKDWSLWTNPEVVEGNFSQNGQIWEFNPRFLRVVNSNENRRIKGGGDEPLLGVVYFSSVLGRPGTSKVIAKDKFLKLGNNIPSGGQVNIPSSANLIVRDNCAPIDDATNTTSGLKAMGYIVVALEEDKFGRGIARKLLRKKAAKLLKALQENFETGNPNGGFLALNNAIGATLAVVAGTNNGFKTEIKNLFTKGLEILGGVDQIGTNYLTVLSYNQAAYDDGALWLRGHEPNAVKQPIAPLTARNFVLELKGSGAVYELELSFGPSMVNGIDY